MNSLLALGLLVLSSLSGIKSNVYENNGLNLGHLNGQLSPLSDSSAYSNGHLNNVELDVYGNPLTLNGVVQLERNNEYLNNNPNLLLNNNPNVLLNGNPNLLLNEVRVNNLRNNPNLVVVNDNPYGPEIVVEGTVVPRGSERQILGQRNSNPVRNIGRSPLIESVDPTWIQTVLTNVLQFNLNYDFTQPPQTQWKAFPTCNGRLQAPIAINTNEQMTVDNNVQIALTQSNLESVPLAVAHNNGHSLPIIVPSMAVSNRYLILNGVKHRLAQANLHYAQNDNEGSVHVVNGRRYPAELHLDWYKPEYGSLTNAARYPDGIVKTAILLEIGRANPALEPIIEALSLIATPNATTAFVPQQPNTAASIIPSLQSRFYWYKGSLDVPPCLESVTWIVFDEVRQISRDQLRRIRRAGLRNTEGRLSQRNSRWIQPRNGRPIYVSNSQNHNSYSTNHVNGY